MQKKTKNIPTPGKISKSLICMKVPSYTKSESKYSLYKKPGLIAMHPPKLLAEKLF